MEESYKRMQMRHGIFFQSSDQIEMANELIAPPRYHWGPIDETLIMSDPIFAVKDRRVRARTRLANGHTCYGFFDQTGTVAYYMWITVAYNAPKAVPWELNTQFVLKSKNGYFWDCFTTPEHRRRGLYRAGLNNALVRAKKEGVEKNYICCMKRNTASIDAIRSSGFHDLFEFTIGRIGPFVFCKRGSNGVSVKFGVPKFEIL